MGTLRTLLLGIGVGLGLAAGLAVTDGLRSAGAEPSDAKLDRRIVKLLKRARKKGTVDGGIVVGVVVDTADPEDRFRVKVRFPWTDGEGGMLEEPWARQITPPEKDGSFFLPEVDDEVIVAFVHGDIRAPVVIGTLWSGEKDPPDR